MKKIINMRSCLLGAVILLMAGCAGVEIRQITRENPYQEGLRFYRPHPYLWITKDKTGGLQGSIVWLPDKNEEYVLKVRSGLGKVDARFTLEDGWNLTGLNEVRDSQTPEMITALTGSLRDVTKVMQMARNEALTPGLYAFVFDDKTGLISDLKPVVQFE